MITRHTPPARLVLFTIYCLLPVQLLSGLSNSDVITLHTAGIGADTIVLAVNNAQDKAFDVSPAALVELKEAGVDEAVIQAILLAGGGSKPVRLPEPVPQEPDPEPSALEAALAQQIGLMEPSPEPSPEPVREATPVAEDPVPPPEPSNVVERTPPKPLFRPAPAYPQELKDKGVTGSVKVKFTVNRDGAVEDINILESDHELFSKAATDALAAWKFEPGLEDGQPADSPVRLSIPFSIAPQTSSLNRPPKPLTNPKPNYPRSLRQQGITGNVKVQVVVGADGKVQDVEVVDSDHELFSQEAVKVLDRWKFAPALQDGKPISSRVQFTIPFKITE